MANLTVSSVGTVITYKLHVTKCHGDLINESRTLPTVLDIIPFGL